MPDQMRFLQKARKIKDALYMNDHQRKEVIVNIETNSSNHNKGIETGIMESSFSDK